MATTAAADQRTDGTSSAGPQPRRKRRGSDRAYYWMVIPAVVLFFLFSTVPVLQGVFYSFTDYKGYGTWDFVGLRNYVNVFLDDRVRSSYVFTIQFALLSTILVNIIALAIAIGLNAKIKFRTALRGIFFMPNVLAVLVVGYIFQYLFTFSLPFIAQGLGIDALSSSSSRTRISPGSASSSWRCGRRQPSR